MANIKRLLDWEGDEDSNLMARKGNYTLAVVHQGKFVWWSVTFNGEPVENSETEKTKTMTMRGGMYKCMYAMRRHKKSLKNVKIE